MNKNPESTVAEAPVERPATAEMSPVRRVNLWDRILGSTRSYSIELLIAVNALLVLGVVTAYSLIALFSYIVGIKDGFAGVFMHEGSLVLVALLLVLLPVALLFYGRTRGELARNPAQSRRAWHKVILGWYYVHVVSFAVAAGFAVVYSVLQLIAGESEVKDILLKVTVPALIALLYFVALYFVYGTRRVSRRVVMISLGVVTLVAALGLLVPTIGHLKDAKDDQKRSDDAKTIAVKVKSYYDEHNAKLPTVLSDLNIPASSLKYKLSDYTYKKDSAHVYQVCADFKTATDEGRRGMGYSSQDPEYADYTRHSKGQHCFKFRAGYGVSTPKLDDYAELFKQYSDAMPSDTTKPLNNFNL